MRTQTFRGKTQDEALSAVKKQLGAEAIIISSRKTRNRNGKIEVLIEASSSSDSVGNHQNNYLSQDSRQESKILDSFRKLLEMSGLSQEHSQWLLEEYWQQNSLNGKSINLTSLASILSSQLSFIHPLYNETRTRIVMGPTGVGKTTTIAKLCGQLIGQKETSIGLITVDTHRVGGAEQLAGFAKLFRIPMLEAATPGKFKDCLYQLKSKKHILIDTAGCGAKEIAKLDELKHLLANTEQIERTILLPASGNTQDFNRIVNAFSNIGLDSIGITKTDETCYFGPCVNVLLQVGLPVTLLGTGQQIPGDLSAATASEIISLLIKATHQ